MPFVKALRVSRRYMRWGGLNSEAAATKPRASFFLDTAAGQGRTVRLAPRIGHIRVALAIRGEV
jgi:hypothetical protein